MEIPNLQPELIWQLIGRRIASGNLHYLDTIDNTGPFSALVYWINGLFFNNSSLSFHIFPFFIIVFQVYYANRMLIKNNAFDETSYIPAFVMIVLFQLSFDFVTLSPALMGSTFVLLALSKLLSQTSVNSNTVPSVLLMGLYAGIAFCFHFPFLIFLPLLIFSGLLINGFSFQQLSLLLTSFLLPVAFCGLFYFWQDGLPAFIEMYFLLALKIEKIYHVSFKDLSYLFALPVVIGTIGYIKNSVARRMSVNQQKQNQLFLLFLIFNILLFFVVDRVSPFQFISAIPVLSYFITHFLTISKKKWAQNIIGYGYFLIIPFIGYSWVFSLSKDNSFNSYQINPYKNTGLPEDKTVMVLGNNLQPYQNSTMASPYLNFRLTEMYFGKMDDMERKIRFYRDLKKEKPDIIIDDAKVFDTWIQDLPKIKPLYSRSENGLLYRGQDE
jgi:hypothetical protein